MAEKILMTALSPTMEEGTILKWNIKEQQPVASGDLLCEVETDKASMDYESTQEGTLLKIIIDNGAMARVGEPIGIIGEKGEDISALLAEIESAGPVSSDSDSSGTHAKPSTTPALSSQPSQPVSNPVEVSSSSIAVVPAPTSGITPNTTSSGKIKASPLARRLAKEQGVDMANIAGSGPGGRIIAKDIQATPESAAIPSYQATLPDLTIPVSGVRAVIAKRLVESKFSAPHYYLSLSINMEVPLAARATLNKGRDPRVSLNAFLIKYVAEAIRRHPEINSSWQGDHIRQFGSVDIGLAVDSGKGLITPVVRDCLNMGVLAIDSILSTHIKNARSGSLKPTDYQGATFTISNLGSFGIDEFSAIINPPAAAILAVGRTQKVPTVAEDGNIVVLPLMKVTLSCDHRVIDGALAAHFLQEMKQLMENPARLIY